MKFKISRNDGVKTLSILGCSSTRAIEIAGSIYIQNKVNSCWIYSSESPTFSSIDEAKDWISRNVDGNDISEYDFQFIMSMYGFYIEDTVWHLYASNTNIIAYHNEDDSVTITIEKDSTKDDIVFKTSDNLVRFLDKVTNNSIDIMLCYHPYTQSMIKCAISSRDLTKNMVRVKSSNVWAYNINIKKHGDKFGDVVVQFKDTKGGPGDIYIYYDVPVNLYRKWHTAPSKGHFFWQYLRNTFSYSKLTGDKRGKLKNAINH